jgi:Immunity protein 35
VGKDIKTFTSWRQIKMDKNTAREIVVNHLSSFNSSSDYKCVILDEYTFERQSLFVFFYESSRFIESGDINDRLSGNSPILIDGQTGNLHLTGSANPIEFYINNFEKFGSTYSFQE